MVRVHHRDTHDAEVSRAARGDDEELGGAEHACCAELCRYFWHTNDATFGVGRGKDERQRARQMLVVGVCDQDNVRV